MEETKEPKWIELACPGLETPILTGKDAEKLLEIMDNVKPISQEERERMIRNYEFMRSIATFDMPECKL